MPTQKSNISNNDIVKTISTVFTQNNLKESKDDNKNQSTYYNMPMNEKIFKKEIFTKKNEDFDEEKKYKTVTNFFRRNKIFENKKIKKRNNLIRKQNQYLSSKNEKKNVSIEDIKELNNIIKCEYFLTSAKNGNGVEDLFFFMAKELFDKKTVIDKNKKGFKLRSDKYGSDDQCHSKARCC